MLKPARMKRGITFRNSNKVGRALPRRPIIRPPRIAEDESTPPSAFCHPYWMRTYSNQFGATHHPKPQDRHPALFAVRCSEFDVRCCPAPFVTSVCFCSTPVPGCDFRLQASDLRLPSSAPRLSGLIRPYPDRNCFRGSSPCPPTTKNDQTNPFSAPPFGVQRSMFVVECSRSFCQPHTPSSTTPLSAPYPPPSGTE